MIIDDGGGGGPGEEFQKSAGSRRREKLSSFFFFVPIKSFFSRLSTERHTRELLMGDVVEQYIKGEFSLLSFVLVIGHWDFLMLFTLWKRQTASGSRNSRDCSAESLEIRNPIQGIPEIIMEKS